MAVALTAGILIVERKEGLLDRSLVAGEYTQSGVNTIFC